MSFDRVLPKPVGLYAEPTTRIHRATSSLLEHKIMNDHHGSSAVKQLSRSNGEFRLTEPESCSTALSKMHINREKIAHNHIPASFAAVTKKRPVLTVEPCPDDRSASSSPTKSEARKEPATQFCLCQPDPKIPRPRNGMLRHCLRLQVQVPKHAS
jgi:HMG box factor